jgi:hypothetical protein
MIGRLVLQALGDGKFKLLLGGDAAREKRRLGREIDGTIAKALKGELDDSEVGHLEQLALMADRLARGGAG